MTTPPQAMESHEDAGSKGPIIALIIVILLALVGYFGYRAFNGEVRTSVGDRQTLVTPKEGKVVSGFPREFLLGENEIDDSYRIEYEDSGISQPTARYYLSRPLTESINAFGELLLAEEWTVVTEPSYDATGPTNFYATRGDEEINITMEPNAGGTDVVISYVVRN